MDNISKLLSHASLPDEVSRILRKQLASNRLMPGDKLPTEKDLAQSFGVSRPVIRESISQLKYDGLVESRQGAGVFVAKASARRSFRVDTKFPAPQDDLRDLFVLRICVEAGAAGLAAQHRTAKQLKNIETALHAMARAIEKDEDGIEADIDFHKNIAMASGNDYFDRFIMFLGGNIRESIATGRKSSSQHAGRPSLVQGEHEAIFEAISAQQADDASNAMRRHLTNSSVRLGLLGAEGK